MTILGSDVAAIRSIVASREGDQFVIERAFRNVDGPPPVFSREESWRVMLGCLLTSQQRSTEGSPVDRFTESRTFQLSWNVCDTPDVESIVSTTLTRFGGIRFAPTIANRCRDNRKWLNDTGWQIVSSLFQDLLNQRSRTPRDSDSVTERRAAKTVCDNLVGFGPKQSRNLWQWLGLSRYEIPLDSRLIKWTNLNLSRQFDFAKLTDDRYYDTALDFIQVICREAEVLPCIFDAAAFDYSDSRLKPKTSTTSSGYVNSNGQVVIRNSGIAGTDHLQYVYQLACSKCGNVYGANGSDIHLRKCPLCQEGAPGLALSKGTHAG